LTLGRDSGGMNLRDLFTPELARDPPSLAGFGFSGVFASPRKLIESARRTAARNLGFYA
jgi:hypothetical protein